MDGRIILILHNEFAGKKQKCLKTLRGDSWLGLFGHELDPLCFLSWSCEAHWGERLGAEIAVSRCIIQIADN